MSSQKRAVPEITRPHTMDASPRRDRESGTRLAPPPVPGQHHFAPLPLGSEAFMAPLPAPPEEPERMPLRRLLLAGVAGAAVVAFAAGAALTLSREPEQAAVGTSAPSAHAPELAEAAAAPPAPLAREVEARTARAPQAGAVLSAAMPAKTTTDATSAAGDGAAPRPATTPAKPDDEAVEGRDVSRKERRARRARRKEVLPDKPSRADVLAGMSRVQPAVRACLPSGRGSVTADVKILGRTGRVTTAQISGQSGTVGSCVARAMRKAKFPKFASDSLSIRYPMRF